MLTACAGAAAQECDPLWSDAFGLRKLDGVVWSLLTIDDGTGPALCASGTFDSDGRSTLDHIARLTGNQWARVGSGLNGGAQDMVYVEAPPLGPALYVCGAFSAAGPIAASRIARWDGTEWSALGDGLTGLALSLAVFDDGGGQALFAGFSDWVGGVQVGGLMRWDGSAWSEVGGGVDNYVADLVVFDDGSGPALFAAGGFAHAGGMPAAGIARWDGASWEEVGGGINGGIWRLAAVVNDGPGVASGLYVGGFFDTAGGVAANGVARWDGRGWSALGLGADDGWAVLEFEVYDDGSGSGPSLFAAASFTQASGDPAAVGLGKWDGTRWSGVGGGVDVIVMALESFDDGTGTGLYVGGLFHSAGDVAAEHVARWNGQSWAPVATGGVDGLSFTYVLALLPEPESDGLIVAGSFSSVATASAHSIAHLGREGWSALGEGVDGYIADLISWDDGSGPGIFAGGGFDHAGDVPAASIARWDGSAWSPLAGGIDGDVFALQAFDDGSGGGPALYAGGDFTQAGGIDARNIARWDGKSWYAVGDIVPVGNAGGTSVRDLAVYDDGTGEALYAGGDFDEHYPDFPSVVRWDGKSWSPVDEIGGAAWALAVFDDGAGAALYAGGFLYTPDEYPASIARWDGESWTIVEGAPSGGICTLEVIDDELGGRPALYAGGDFFLGRRAIIARWDGSAWLPLGFGPKSEEDAAVCAIAGVADLDGEGPSIFAGGEFTTIYVEAPGDDLEEIPSGRIGRWLLCPPAAGDIDGDGAIGVADLELLLDAWGPCALPCPPACAGDVDHDCTVGVTDLLMLLAEWAP